SHVPQIVLIVAMLCALTVVNMAVPYAIKLIVDRVLPGPNHEANWSLTLPILAGIGVAYLLRNGLFFASRMLSVTVAEDMCYRLRSELFGRLQGMTVDSGAPEH